MIRADNRADDRVAAPAAETPVEEPVDALGRMDAFARRVGFQPTRLPCWLTARLCDHPECRGGSGGDDVAAVEGPVFRFGWAELLPSLTLYLNLSHHDLRAGAGGVVRWEGEGPVSHQFVHQLDHTLGYHPARASRAERHWSTRIGNLAPLARFGHRIKTHGHWTVRQLFAGIHLWRDPHGQIYLVDHTGTHKITHPGTTAGSATTYDPDIELHPAGDTILEVDLDHTS